MLHYAIFVQDLYVAICLAARCLLSGVSGTCSYKCVYDKPVSSVVLHCGFGPVCSC